MGFLAPQASPPIADETLPNFVDLLHVTAAPPVFTNTGISVAFMILKIESNLSPNFSLSLMYESLMRP
jgi:hypothetical protein